MRILAKLVDLILPGGGIARWAVAFLVVVTASFGLGGCRGGAHALNDTSPHTAKAVQAPGVQADDPIRWLAAAQELDHARTGGDKATAMELLAVLETASTGHVSPETAEAVDQAVTAALVEFGFTRRLEAYVTRRAMAPTGVTATQLVALMTARNNAGRYGAAERDGTAALRVARWANDERGRTEALVGRALARGMLGMESAEQDLDALSRRSTGHVARGTQALAEGVYWWRVRRDPAKAMDALMRAATYGREERFGWVAATAWAEAAGVLASQGRMEDARAAGRRAVAAASGHPDLLRRLNLTFSVMAPSHAHAAD